MYWRTAVLLFEVLPFGIRIQKLEAKDKLLKMLRRREVLPLQSDSLNGEKISKS